MVRDGRDKAAAGLDGSPGRVGRKAEALRMGEMQKRIVGGKRLCDKHIQRCTRDGAGIDGGREGGFVDDAAAAHVHEESRRFHPGKFRRADEALRPPVQRGMDGDDVARSEQLIQFQRGKIPSVNSPLCE